MANDMALFESYQAHYQALHKVQLAMRRESNPVARRELVATWGRLVDKMETLRKRLSAFDSKLT